MPGLFASSASLRKTKKPARRKDWFIASRFSRFSSEDLFNVSLIRHQVYRRVPGMTLRSQRGLFHGKRMRSAHTTCFSEKKNLRSYKPNVFKKRFWSSVLNRRVQVYVTATFLKKLRHYGGFDNYVLLARPEQMWSSFGEYLRRVMLLKLGQPQLPTENYKIFGLEPSQYKSRRARREIKNPMFLPGSLRHTDLTPFSVNTLDTFSRGELRILRAHREGPEALERYAEQLSEIEAREAEFERKAAEFDTPMEKKLRKWIAYKSKTSPKFLQRWEMQAKSHHISFDVPVEHYFDKI